MGMILLPTTPRRRIDLEKEVLLHELKDAPERIKSARKSVRQARETFAVTEEEAFSAYL